MQGLSLVGRFRCRFVAARVPLRKNLQHAMLLDKNLRLSSTPIKPVKHMPRGP